MHATHYIPEIIKEETWKALSFYPVLGEIPICIEFTSNANASLTQVSPYWTNLLPWSKRRSYTILINESFVISGKLFFTTEIPKNAIIGLIGHTLGIVMYLENLSKKELIQHKLHYFFSKKYKKEVFYIANNYAIVQNMNQYLLDIKNFIIEKATLSPLQKTHIHKLESSPEELIDLINTANFEAKNISIPS